MDRYLLQKFVFPSIEEQDCQNLFVRKFEAKCNAFGSNLSDVVEYRFDTWMNLFAAAKWFHYCDLGKISLGIRAIGDYIVEIVGAKHNGAFIIINETLACEKYEDKEGKLNYIDVPGAENYEAVYVRLRECKDNPIDVKEMGWYTDKPAGRNNLMAIVTCTYKRENYIKRTISRFNDYLAENTDIKDKMHMFVIDNGQTIPMTEANDNVSVVYNKNAGGAGGFGRGIIEVCKADEEYTRCVLIDDDVKILPESFYRTLIFSNYLSEEFKDATINGAMLDMYAPNHFYENLGVQDKLWVGPAHPECDLIDFANILKVNEINDDLWKRDFPKADAAWFYSCISIKESTINDLPLPCFIRGDDVEYSWRRNGKPIIQLNGICIWHANFWYRVSKVTDVYYLARNMLIINMLYTKGFENEYSKLINERFWYYISSYDYTSARLLIRALSDVLKGKTVFDIDPVANHQELAQMAKEQTVRETDWYKLEEVRNRPYYYGFWEIRINSLAKKIFKLIPASKNILKKNSEKSVGEWYPPVEAFLFRKHVRVYNLLSHTYYYRHFDYKRERELVKEYKDIMKQLNSRYNELRETFVTEHDRWVSFDFWKNHLELENAN